jgi:hypothetical protein
LKIENTKKIIFLLNRQDPKSPTLFASGKEISHGFFLKKKNPPN